MQKHTLSILVNNHPGVLQRICGLFARRSYNIESIAVGPSEEESLSRIIIVVQAEIPMLDQMNKQLRKLLDVIRVVHLNANPMIARELMLIKLRADPAVRSEIFGMVETFRCSVVDVGPSSVVIQVVGDTNKNNAFVLLLEPYGILEQTRTGETAMMRGDAKNNQAFGDVQ